MKKQRISKIHIFISLLILFLIRVDPVNGQLLKSDSLSNKRKPDLRKMVAENKHAANTWWYSWLVGYGAATVVQGGVAISSPELTTRQDMWNGAATTFLGVAGLLVTPLVPKESDVNKLMIAETGPGHIYSDSDFSKATLKEIARREQFGRSWKVHAITGVVNIGSGLVTWLGFKRTFGAGVVTFAINTAVTEAQIWSQPKRAIRDYNKYIQAHNGGTLVNQAVPQKQWMVSATPGGVNIRLRF